MAATGSSLRFTVEVAADQADKTLKAMTVAFNEAGAQARIAMSGMGGAARNAGGEVTVLGDRIKQIARDQRTEARTARFYASELASIIPGAQGAGVALTGLSQVLIAGATQGFGFGVAFEAVKLAVELAVREFERAKEITKEMKEATDAVAIGYAGATQRMRELSEITTAGMKAAREELKAWQPRLNDIQAAQEKVKASGHGILEYLAAAFGAPNAFSSQNAALEKLNETQREAIRNASNFAEVQRAIATEASSATAALARQQDVLGILYKDEEARKGFRRASQDAALKTRMLWMSEDQRIVAEGEQAILEIQRKAADDWNYRSSASYRRDLANAKAYYEDKLRIAQLRRPDTSGQPTVAGFMGLEAATFDPKTAIEAAARAQREYNQQVRESVSQASEWGTAIGGAVGELVSGQQTVGQMVAQIGQQVIKSVVQNAITQITADAAVTGAEGAKATAGIPVFGPVLAISTMGALMSAVLGLLSKVPSAKGGWWDTGQYEGLAYIHRREMVADAPMAKRIREGGGAGITVQVNAFDVNGIERAFAKPNGDIARGLRKAQRKRGA
jgi:hypothetical protein